MIDLVAVADAFTALRALTDAEDSLRDFRAIATDLERQAHDLRSGTRTLARLDRRGPPIPSRDLAAAIVAIFATIPYVDGDEPAELRSAIARLLGNLSVGMIGSIFRDYPDVIPRG